jgi:drug/metabolite transporter (DMT)-like permease
MLDKPKLYTYPVLVLSMIFWSMSFIWVKIVFKYLSPTATIFIRLIIASFFLIGLSALLGKLQRIDRKDYLRFLLLALFEPFLYYLGESYGLLYVSSTVAAIVVSTIPLFLPFFMYLLAREKISSGSYIGVLISFSGVLLIVLNNDLTFSASPKGLLFLMLAIASVMGYSYLLQILARRYNALTIISAQNFIGIFMFLPFFLIIDVPGISNVKWTAELILSICALAVFASSLAFFLYTLAMQQIGITKATVFTYIIPVFTALLSFIFLDEDFPPRKIIGIAITIGGLFLSQIDYRSLFGRKKRVSGPDD